LRHDPARQQLRQPAAHRRDQIVGQKLARPVDRFDFAADHPEDQHVEDDVPDAVGRVQEGIRQQPPDLPVMKDRGRIVIERFGEGPAVRNEIHAIQRGSRRDLNYKSDNGDGDQRRADLPGPLEDREHARPFAAVVIAIVDAHSRLAADWPDCPPRALFYQIRGVGGKGFRKLI
jgi:hypothetical protein